MWYEIAAGIVGTLFTVYGIPLLNRLRDESKTRAANLHINMQGSLLQQRGVIVKMLGEFLEQQAISLGSTHLPRIAADVAAGRLREPGSVKRELYALGEAAKQQAREYFGRMDVDVVAVVGEKVMDDMLSAIVAKTGPFPGKETATELLKDKVAPMLVNWGSSWVRQYYNGSLPQHEVVMAAETGLLPSEHS